MVSGKINLRVVVANKELEEGQKVIPDSNLHVYVISDEK